MLFDRDFKSSYKNQRKPHKVHQLIKYQLEKCAQCISLSQSNCQVLEGSGAKQVAPVEHEDFPKTSANGSFRTNEWTEAARTYGKEALKVQIRNSQIKRQQATMMVF